MKIFLYFLFFPLISIGQSNYTTLLLSNIELIESNGVKSTREPFVVYLKDGERNRNNYFFENERITIQATFKVESYNSRRSSNKTGAIKVTVIYRSEFQGVRDKRTSEYLFYIDDDRKFDLKESFVFKNGLKSNRIIVTCKGELKE